MYEFIRFHEPSTSYYDSDWTSVSMLMSVIILQDKIMLIVLSWINLVMCVLDT